MRRLFVPALLVACSADAPVDPATDSGAADSAMESAPSDAGNRAPEIQAIPPQTIPEEATLDLPLVATDPDGDALSWDVRGLPPGARFDRASHHVIFRPDFVQGGVPKWDVDVTVSDGSLSVKATFSITVTDSIAPPDPTITKTETVGACTRSDSQFAAFGSL